MFLEKVVVFWESCCNGTEVVVFGQSGSIREKNCFIRTKWLFSGKNCYIRAKWLYLGKSGCLRAKWLES